MGRSATAGNCSTPLHTPHGTSSREQRKKMPFPLKKPLQEYRTQLLSCFVAEIRTEFDHMYIPTYHLSYKKKKNSMQNPPTFAKNYSAASSQHHHYSDGAYTYTSFSPASFPWLSAAFKEITFISKKCDICHSTASTQSRKPHARCLAERVRCTATCAGRNREAAMLFGKLELGCDASPSSCPRARKSL